MEGEKASRENKNIMIDQISKETKNNLGSFNLKNSSEALKFHRKLDRNNTKNSKDTHMSSNSSQNILLFKNNIMKDKEVENSMKKFITPKINIKESEKLESEILSDMKLDDFRINVEHKPVHVPTYRSADMKGIFNNTLRSSHKLLDHSLAGSKELMENPKILNDNQKIQSYSGKMNKKNLNKSNIEVIRSMRLDEVVDENQNLNVSALDENLINQNINNKIHFDASTIEKKATINNHEDSIINIQNKSNNNTHSDLNKNRLTLTPELKKVNVQLALKDDTLKDDNKLKEKELSSDSNLMACRICYEGDSEEKGGLIFPCTCTGSCKFIHETCLKTWIENNFSSNKIKAECEICKHHYAMKFYMKHRYSKKKVWNFLKSLCSVVIITGVILTLIFVVIYVVVTALTNMNDNERKNFINIIVSIGLGLLVIITIISFRNCKKNFYEPYMSDWKIFNLDGSKNKIIKFFFKFLKFFS
jgi:hypothetical protein